MWNLVFATFVLSAAPVPADTENIKALKALEGKWKLVAAEEKGEAVDAKYFDLQMLTVTGTVLAELNEKGKETLRYGIKVDVSQSPAHIDWVWLDDEGKPTQHAAHAIYKLGKDRLTVCFGHNITPDEPKDRPREFTTGAPKQRPPKGKVLIVLERVKN